VGNRSQDRLSIGVLGRAHGVRGEIRFRPFSGDVSLFSAVQLPVDVFVGDPTGVDASKVQRLTVVKAREAADLVLLQFQDVSSREAVSKLTNAEVSLNRDQLPALQADEFYVEDLIGCAVRDQDGRSRGDSVGVFWNGAYDVLVVQEGQPPQTAEHMVPVQPEFLLELDLEAKRLQLVFLEEDVGA